MGWGYSLSEIETWRCPIKPYCHARNSVKKWGGNPEDYLPIHDFIDSTKAALPDVRHRAILHNAFGCFLVEKVFGTYIVNSAGTKVQTRDIAEDHIIEDLGFIPTIQDYLKHMPIVQWFGGRVVKKTTIPFKREDRSMTVVKASTAVIDGGGGKIWREKQEDAKWQEQLKKDLERYLEEHPELKDVQDSLSKTEKID